MSEKKGGGARLTLFWSRVSPIPQAPPHQQLLIKAYLPIVRQETAKDPSLHPIPGDHSGFFPILVFFLSTVLSRSSLF